MITRSRIRLSLTMLGVAFVLCAAVTTGVLVPAAATGPEGITSFSGTSAGAIVASHNSGTGQAISASGSTGAGTGVIYATTAAAGSTAIRGYASATSGSPSYGVIGVSKNAYGVEAVTYSPSLPALFALNAATSGGAIKGQSAGNAVTGISSKANGVVGQVTATPTPMPSAIVALAGVLGQDPTTSLGGHNAGVEGTTINGEGVYGLATGCCGTGVFGQAPNGVAVYGTSKVYYGVWGISNSNIGVYGTSSSSVAVKGVSSSSVGVFAQSFATPRPDATTLPNANNIFTAALAIHGNGGAPLIIARGSAGTDVMSLDNSGNLRIAGNLYANSSTVGTPGNPLAVHRTATGRQIGTYAAEQTERTIEDIGEARLVNGRAYVRLDPTFAATIDQHANYLVFITPQGPTPGLYVTQKTPAGFVVREYAGQATIAFDYRIVAKPLDSNAGRLPLLRAAGPGANDPAPLVRQRPW